MTTITLAHVRRGLINDLYMYIAYGVHDSALHMVVTAMHVQWAKKKAVRVYTLLHMLPFKSSRMCASLCGNIFLISALIMSELLHSMELGVCLGVCTCTLPQFSIL